MPRGGARPGAGRPKKKPVFLGDIQAPAGDPKAFLLAVMNHAGAEAKARLEAAKALLPYMYPRIGEGGKKEQKDEAAKKVATGKFAPMAGPAGRVLPLRRND
jgi:phage terminase small subunit